MDKEGHFHNEMTTANFISTASYLGIHNSCAVRCIKDFLTPNEQEMVGLSCQNTLKNRHLFPNLVKAMLCRVKKDAIIA